MRISDWSSDVCSSDLASLVVRVKMPTIPTREWKQMPFFMVAASHSPLLDFPARESSSVLNILAALEQARARIRAFDPELVILFGVELGRASRRERVCQYV